jgi:ankyrin repeat protein
MAAPQVNCVVRLQEGFRVGRHLDTALFRETRNASGSVERVRELIAAGANVNRRHKFGNTPLWEAAFHGREDLVVALLAAGADANVYADDGGGPLHWAVQNGHVTLVELLLAHGADPNALRNGDFSVLAAAIAKCDDAIVRRLVEAGAAVDHRYFGRSMPEYARYCGRPEIAALLRRWRRTRPADPKAPADPPVCP